MLVHLEVVSGKFESKLFKFTNSPFFHKIVTFFSFYHGMLYATQMERVVEKAYKEGGDAREISEKYGKSTFTYCR
jgi:hypothetical protein